MNDDDPRSREELLREAAGLRGRVAELEALVEKLKRSEERYRSVVCAMTEGVVLQEQSGEVVACNPAAGQILGVSPLIGRTSLAPPWPTIHEDGSPFPPEAHPAPAALRTGRPQNNVLMGARKPDGSLAWILVNSEPLKQPGSSEPYAVLTTLKDVTEHHQALQMLRESEQKHRVLFDNKVYAICIFDADTLELLDANEAHIRLYGYSRAELLAGMTIRDITAEPGATEAAIRQAVEEGRIFLPLRYHRKKDGTVFPVEIVAGPYERQGRRLMFTVAHDITRRKQDEAERERLIGELRAALTKVKQLEGILPICGFCKKIRDREDEWQPLEDFISRHSQAEFSHTFCPSCGREHYPEYYNGSEK